MIRRVIFRDAASFTGSVFLAIILLAMVIWPLISPWAPLEIDMSNRLLPPGGGHWFGTDEMGRDRFVRVAHGGVYTLGSSLCIIASSALIGLALGGISGYFGKWADTLIMRLCDIFMAFPQLLLAMLVSFSLGASIRSTIIALVITWWPTYTRTVRGMVLELKNRQYVYASLAAGARAPHIIFRRILPHTLSTVISRATTDVGFAILVSSGLAFIGLGAQPPLPEWGSMISTSQEFIFKAPWYGVFPGLAIFITVLGLGLTGDSLELALGGESSRHDQAVRGGILSGRDLFGRLFTGARSSKQEQEV
jgi:peptide/nickel transport system permease protein